MIKLSSSIFVLVAAMGCGGGGKNGPNVLPDSNNGGGEDAPPPAACLVSPSLGTVAPTQQVAEFSNDMATPPAPATYFWLGDINAEANQDLIAIELYKGFGVFTTEFPSGPTTVQIAGAETNYETCGACIRVFADVPDMGNQAADYFATAGTIEFTTISTTRIAGTMTNLTLTHVNILPEAPFTSSPHPDGCTSSLGNLAFDAVPMMAMAKKNGQVGIKLDPSTIRFYAN